MNSHGEQENDSIKREIIELSCYNNITTTYDEVEIVEFSSFILKSRFNNDHNLRLAYLLIHGHRISLSNAARAMRVSRTLFYNQILPENPAFISARKAIQKWASGGTERVIMLSDEAKKHLSLLEILSVRHLGVNECQRLKIVAAKARRGLLKEQESEEKKMAMSLKTLRRILREKPYDYDSKLGVHARLRGIDPLKLDGLVRE